MKNREEKNNRRKINSFSEACSPILSGLNKEQLRVLEIGEEEIGIETTFEEVVAPNF